MDTAQASMMRPAAQPQVFEGAYSEDQHRRMLDVARGNGPFKLILAQHFNSAEELIATAACSSTGRQRKHRSSHGITVVVSAVALPTGPVALRNPTGLSMNSVIEADPDKVEGWRIVDEGRILQSLPEQEFLFLVHWGGIVYTNYQKLKVSKDHSDDLSHEQVFNRFIADLKKRGMHVEEPSDPMTDKSFIKLLTSVYDPGLPLYCPPEPEEVLAS